MHTPLVNATLSLGDGPAAMDPLDTFILLPTSNATSSRVASHHFRNTVEAAIVGSSFAGAIGCMMGPLAGPPGAAIGGAIGAAVGAFGY